MEKLLHKSILAAVEAGKEILNVYGSDFSSCIDYKADNSPLTIADSKSNEVIKAALADTGYPFLSEEGKHFEYEERKGWNTFWLIDPLDGTKEFIKKNGEFTVNIALIKNGKPILGVVYVPVTGALYFGTENSGSYTFQVNELFNIEELNSYIEKALPLPLAVASDTYTIVASRTHSSPETEAFIESKRKIQGKVDLTSAGSSLKLCLVAEGKAHIYPRLAPTMEWDTAAGHAVAKFAGCQVYNFETNQELTYNKESLLNPWFVVEA